ncbi:MAG: hypothetical protein ACK5LC_12480 [Coprobacillaceae bacterium]
MDDDSFTYYFNVPAALIFGTIFALLAVVIFDPKSKSVGEEFMLSSTIRGANLAFSIAVGWYFSKSSRENRANKKDR